MILHMVLWGFLHNLYWAKTCCTLLAAIAGGRPLGGNDTEAGIRRLTADVTCRLLVQHPVAQYRFLHNPPKRCIKRLGQVLGVSKSLRCPEMGILRRLLQPVMSEVSQSVPCEPSFSAAESRNSPNLAVPATERAYCTFLGGYAKTCIGQRHVAQLLARLHASRRDC